MCSGTAEIRTQVRRTPCAEDTATPRSRIWREDAAGIKPFGSVVSGMKCETDDNSSFQKEDDLLTEKD